MSKYNYCKYAHHSFSEPNMISSKVLFCTTSSLKPKHIKFAFIQKREKTVNPKKLKPEVVWYFCWMTDRLYWSRISWLFFLYSFLIFLPPNKLMNEIMLVVFTAVKTGISRHSTRISLSSNHFLAIVENPQSLNNNNFHQKFT